MRFLILHIVFLKAKSGKMGGSACLLVWLKYCFLMILLLHMYWDFRVRRFDRGVKIFYSVG